MQTFPHRVQLHVVMQQDEDLIDAINELCIGNPYDTSVQLIRSLQRPIPKNDKTVFIYGTNFDLDFFNHTKLTSMPGLMQVFQSEDNCPKKYMKLTNASKTLALKNGCRVIIICNLDIGLVNGLTAKVLSIQNDSIEIEIEEDEHLQHGIEGKSSTSKNLYLLL